MLLITPTAATKITEIRGAEGIEPAAAALPLLSSISHARHVLSLPPTSDR